MNWRWNKIVLSPFVFIQPKTKLFITCTSNSQLIFLQLQSLKFSTSNTYIPCVHNQTRIKNITALRNDDNDVITSPLNIVGTEIKLKLKHFLRNRLFVFRMHANIRFTRFTIRLFLPYSSFYFI